VSNAQREPSLTGGAHGVFLQPQALQLRTSLVLLLFLLAVLPLTLPLAVRLFLLVL